jgi:hypothetical protein
MACWARRILRLGPDSPPSFVVAVLLVRPYKTGPRSLCLSLQTRLQTCLNPRLRALLGKNNSVSRRRPSSLGAGPEQDSRLDGFAHGAVGQSFRSGLRKVLFLSTSVLQSEPHYCWFIYR